MMVQRHSHESPAIRLDKNALICEFFGTAGLLCAITISLAVTESTVVHAVIVGVTLAILISVGRAKSGAHFNPFVTVSLGIAQKHSLTRVFSYSAAQIVGGACGVIVSNGLLQETLLTSSNASPVPIGFGASETIAAGGLVMLVVLLARKSTWITGVAVGGYIALAITVTPSGAQANPAVTLARLWTDTNGGVHFSSALVFLVGQAVGALLVIIVVLAVQRRSLPVVQPPRQKDSDSSGLYLT